MFRDIYILFCVIIHDDYQSEKGYIIDHSLKACDMCTAVCTLNTEEPSNIMKICCFYQRKLKSVITLYNLQVLDMSVFFG